MAPVLGPAGVPVNFIKRYRMLLGNLASVAIINKFLHGEKPPSWVGWWPGRWATGAAGRWGVGAWGVGAGGVWLAGMQTTDHYSE